MQAFRSRIQRLLGSADYPGEVLTGVPVVEIKGDTEASVLNHRGVLAYDPQAVRIATAIGQITLTGCGLRVFRMNRERIVLHGKISCVQIGEAAL